MKTSREPRARCAQEPVNETPEPRPGAAFEGRVVEVDAVDVGEVRDDEVPCVEDVFPPDPFRLTRFVPGFQLGWDAVVLIDRRPMLGIRNDLTYSVLGPLFEGFWSFGPPSPLIASNIASAVVSPMTQ